jgi:hypothetical protein
MPVSSSVCNHSAGGIGQTMGAAEEENDPPRSPPPPALLSGLLRAMRTVAIVPVCVYVVVYFLPEEKSNIIYRNQTIERRQIEKQSLVVV